jgi:histidyl-tRNA synthetase
MIQAPKGTKDCLPQDSFKFQHIENVMRKHAALAGYREIRTPVFEYTELFLRGVGDTTDIVQKEMYTFEDKGGRSITLKPEGTAGAVRALIEGKLYAQAQPVKMYYINNPIFRYENPQQGRLREHHQFGMECFGAKEPSADAELISGLLNMLTELGLDDLTVNINSIGCPSCRPLYHQKLRGYLAGHMDQLCDNCKERFDRNPLRVLDCKETGCKNVVKHAPVILDTLCEECADHFTGLRGLLDTAGVNYKIDPMIVRGLDYYTKTVFEIIMHGRREGLALCGGGRYDGLVEQLGGPQLSGVGFGIGIERVLMEIETKGIEWTHPPVYEVFVANISPGDFSRAFELALALRANGIRTDCDHTGRNLRAQFKYANKLGIRMMAIVGGEELERGNIRLRDMQSGEETEVPAETAHLSIAEKLKG